MTKNKYTVTAALPYANGPLHFGHIAGVYLPSDIFVRFLRMKKHDVLFVCGSDEHGAAITLRAKKDGVTPEEIVERYNTIIQDTFKKFDVSFDIFHRTSSEIHHKTAQDFFKLLHDKGEFIKKTSEQYYDEEYNQFLADRYIKGTCPHCHNEDAYGDQCEKCGATLNPTDLIDPKSTLSGNKPIMRSTFHWYLPMQNHEKWLTDWLKKGMLNDSIQHDASKWKNQVIGQCMSWIDSGLRPRAMTRDLNWGVKVPIKDGDGKVLYVWLDAPIGYISATKQWAKENQKDWKEYWTGDRKLIHFIGKDNIVFHAIIFPILLKSHGEFILPENVPAYEFLNLEGDKFSTSKNWAVWLHEYIERYPNKIDELKYVLTSIAPESKDSEFTWKEYQTRINNELADILGNFINRTLVLTQKYYQGKAPEVDNLNSLDEKVIEHIKEIPNKISSLIYSYKIREAQAEAINLARIGNKYLADMEPWKIVKTDPIRVQTIINIALQITANLSIILQPFLPITAEKISGFLNFKKTVWEDAGKMNLISSGHETNKPTILFEKIEDQTVTVELEHLEASSN